MTGASDKNRNRRVQLCEQRAISAGCLKDQGGVAGPNHRLFQSDPVVEEEFSWDEANGTLPGPNVLIHLW